MSSGITKDDQIFLGEQGRKIQSLESSAAVEWWVVGQYLETNTHLHTGYRKGSISNEDTIKICEYLGLSTKLASNGQPHGLMTIYRSRKFYRLANSVEERDAVILKYKSWHEIVASYFCGRKPSSFARQYPPRGPKPLGYRMPHRLRNILAKILEEFQAESGCTSDEAYEALINVCLNLEWHPLLERMI